MENFCDAAESYETIDSIADAIAMATIIEAVSPKKNQTLLTEAWQLLIELRLYYAKSNTRFCFEYFPAATNQLLATLLNNDQIKINSDTIQQRLIEACTIQINALDTSIQSISTEIENLLAEVQNEVTKPNNWNIKDGWQYVKNVTTQKVSQIKRPFKKYFGNLKLSHQVALKEANNNSNPVDKQCAILQSCIDTNRRLNAIKEDIQLFKDNKPIPERQPPENPALAFWPKLSSLNQSLQAALPKNVKKYNNGQARHALKPLRLQYINKECEDLTNQAEQEIKTLQQAYANTIAKLEQDINAGKEVLAFKAAFTSDIELYQQVKKEPSLQKATIILRYKELEPTKKIITQCKQHSKTLNAISEKILSSASEKAKQDIELFITEFGKYYHELTAGKLLAFSKKFQDKIESNNLQHTLQTLENEHQELTNIPQSTLYEALVGNSYDQVMKTYKEQAQTLITKLTDFIKTIFKKESEESLEKLNIAYRESLEALLQLQADEQALLDQLATSPYAHLIKPLVVNYDIVTEKIQKINQKYKQQLENLLAKLDNHEDTKTIQSTITAISTEAKKELNLPEIAEHKQLFIQKKQDLLQQIKQDLITQHKALCEKLCNLDQKNQVLTELLELFNIVPDDFQKSFELKKQLNILQELLNIFQTLKDHKNIFNKLFEEHIKSIDLCLTVHKLDTNKATNLAHVIEQCKIIIKKSNSQINKYLEEHEQHEVNKATKECNDLRDQFKLKLLAFAIESELISTEPKLEAEINGDLFTFFKALQTESSQALIAHWNNLYFKMSIEEDLPSEESQNILLSIANNAAGALKPLANKFSSTGKINEQLNNPKTSKKSFSDILTANLTESQQKIVKAKKDFEKKLNKCYELLATVKVETRTKYKIEIAQYIDRIQAFIKKHEQRFEGMTLNSIPFNVKQDDNTQQHMTFMILKNSAEILTTQCPTKATEEQPFNELCLYHKQYTELASRLNNLDQSISQTNLPKIP